MPTVLTGVASYEVLGFTPLDFQQQIRTKSIMPTQSGSLSLTALKTCEIGNERHSIMLKEALKPFSFSDGVPPWTPLERL